MQEAFFHPHILGWVSNCAVKHGIHFPGVDVIGAADDTVGAVSIPHQASPVLHTKMNSKCHHAISVSERSA